MDNLTNTPANPGTQGKSYCLCLPGHRSSTKRSPWRPVPYAEGWLVPTAATHHSHDIWGPQGTTLDRWGKLRLGDGPNLHKGSRQQRWSQSQIQVCLLPLQTENYSPLTPVQMLALWVGRDPVCRRCLDTCARSPSPEAPSRRTGCASQSAGGLTKCG